MSASDRVQLAYIKEAEFGVTPSGNFQNIRFTGESLVKETQSTASNEIRPDRQVADMVRTAYNAGGSVNTELSFGSYDEFFEAALCADNTWSSTEGESDVTCSIDSSTKSITRSSGSFDSIIFGIGKYIKISGSSQGNNGIYKITNFSSNALILQGTFTSEADVGLDISGGSDIENGVSSSSYSIEKSFTDLSEFLLYSGMMIESMSLNVSTGEIITGSFEFIGNDEKSAAASAGDGSNTAAPTTSPMNAVDDITGVIEDGVSTEITTFSLQLKNNLRKRMVVGKSGLASIDPGQISLTGSIQAYMEDSTLADKFRNWTTSSLAVQFVDAAGNGYVIELPAVKYTSAKNVAGGKNQDVMTDMQFEAFMCPIEKKTIRITRFSA